MSFAKPMFLVGLLIAPLVAFWLLGVHERKKRLLAKLGDASLIGRLSESVNWRGRMIKNIMWLIGMGLVVVALARPQWGTESQVVRQRGIEVMVALDVSESMLAEDVPPSRLGAAKQSINELMDGLGGDEIGLVLFSGASFVQFPLTSDYNTAAMFLGAASPGIISRGGTVIGEAIRTAVGGFTAEGEANRVIIIMTDGEDHETEPIAAANEAFGAGILVYTVGFGTADGATVPDGQGGVKVDRTGNAVVSRLVESELIEIAEVGGGRYFRANAAGDEVDDLLKEIERLEADDLDERLDVRPIERFQWFLLPAILLFALGELIPDRKRGSREGAEMRSKKDNHRGAEGAESFNHRGTEVTERLVGVLILAFVLVGCGAVDQSGQEMVNQGNALFDEGQFAVSETVYGSARAFLRDAADPVYNLANAQYKQGKFEEAAVNLDGLEANELEQFISYNRGNVGYQLGEFGAAVEDYKAALRLDPDDVDAKVNLELALQQEQENEEQQEQSDEQDEQGDDSGEESEESEDEESESEEQDQSGGENQDEQDERGEEEQNEQQNESPQPPDGSGDEQDEPEAEPSEPEPEESPSEDEMQAGSEPQQGELTPEQAMQLLRAAGNQSETLQERMERQFVAPNSLPPEKDW